MIIVAIIALSTVVLVALYAIFSSLPTIPTEFFTVIMSYMPYVTRGVKFINSFMYANIVMPMALVTLALHSFWTIYRVTMWVVKKIPMFGVSD